MRELILRSRLHLHIVAATLVTGCVHAPLERDDEYPIEWPSVMPLTDQCRGLAGTYRSIGSSTRTGSRDVAISLFDTLNLKATADSASLEVLTQRIDDKGDSFSTLIVIPGNDTTTRYELKNCYCVKQTLVCAALGEAYWRVPNLGFGGKQSNVYIGTATDHSLIVKLQNYRIDMVLGIPFFKIVEPWARFAPASP